MKTLFLVAQCIRILNTDPWQSKTHYILEIGNFSYYTKHVVQLNTGRRHFGQDDSVSFSSQKKFMVVPCPGVVK